MKTKIVFVFILLQFAYTTIANNSVQKPWFHQFVPMGSFKYSEMTTLKDSAMLPTIEFGFARVFGEKNDFGSWGILPLTSRGPYPDYLSSSFVELRVLLWDVDY